MLTAFLSAWTERAAGWTMSLSSAYGKSVKYEDIYLKAYASMAEVKSGLATYFEFYNKKRWHHTFDRKTPAMVYSDSLPQKQAAA